jgi:hypothetical protein
LDVFWSGGASVRSPLSFIGHEVDSSHLPQSAVYAAPVSCKELALVDAFAECLRIAAVQITVTRKILVLRRRSQPIEAIQADEISDS